MSPSFAEIGGSLFPILRPVLSRAGHLALWLLPVAVGCDRPAPPAEWSSGPGHRWRALEVRSAATGFTPIGSKISGIRFSNDVSDSLLTTNRNLGHGSGVALGDVDGDDRVDIVLAGIDRPTALYRNQGGLRFEDVSGAAGLSRAPAPTTGVVLADADGDRDLDLFLSSLGGPNRLLLNDGAGHFTPDPAYPGETVRLGSVTTTLADVDGDGDLDLFVATHKTIAASDRYSPEEKSYGRVVQANAAGTPEVLDRWQGEFRLVIENGKPRLIERADPDLFYLNDGKGRFEQVPLARSPRFRDEQGRILDEEPDYFGLAARFYDINGDRAPELVIANDFQDPDQFWINDGKGNFSLIARLAVKNTCHSTMAVDFADVNRDGLVDVFEADMRSRDAKQRRAQRPASSIRSRVPGDPGPRSQFARNVLLLNRGDQTFRQVGEYAGVDATGWTWGSTFIDVDLDGYEDLLVATGNRWNEVDPDVYDQFQRRPKDYRMQTAGYDRLDLPNYALRNRGDLTFEEVGNRWHFNVGPGITHGIASADLDGDGDQDVVINRFNNTALIFRNESTAPRVAIRLVGDPPNTAGVGAKIRVRGGPVPVQEREVTAGGLYLSHADYLLSFATGTSDSVEIEVIWRDGRTSRLPAAQPNREYRIEQSSAVQAQPTAGSTVVAMFADVSDRLAHAHREAPFPEDDIRQPLRLSTLSELGPGVTIADLDADGDEDLVIGTGRGGQLTWHRNDGTRFATMPIGPSTQGDLTTVLPLPARRGSSLLVGQSNYESFDQATTIPPVYSIGPSLPRAQPDPIGPIDSVATGPLALADIDADGDLDLFVGGRVIPGEYPADPGARLLRNRGDNSFEIDRDNASVLAQTGMVSAAVFSDVDGDSDPDLLLAIDWGPIKLYRNDGGRYTLVSGWGLEGRTARWIGIATGDFDRDGRPDLVTTTLGRNLQNLPDPAWPVTLFFGQFDRDLSRDLIVAQLDSSTGQLEPLTDYARIRTFLPEIGGRFPTHAAYAQATMKTIFGARLDGITSLSINSSDQTLWLNRGGRFEPISLDPEAQLAPAFAPVVADFDGDGADDLFLSQNLTATEPEQLPLDAGRGLLMLGDGHGRFTAIAGQVSGISVWGDQRGAAAGDLNRDGRPDLVISQNGASTKVYENRTGRPGVRVVLDGRGANPLAIGAALRIHCGTRSGPRREVQAGSGYWSMNSPSQILARPGRGACSVEVRWPTGPITVTPVAETVTHLTIREPR